MKFVSLFAGIGGFDLGMERQGYECVGQVEIDKHAVSILEKHWPGVPRHDNVKTLKADTFEYPDVVTFGSPCQDLSLAGKHAGLAGKRSSLFLDAVKYIRAVQKKTNGEYPKYAIWENVPGSFFSNGGEDFATVLKEMVGGKVSVPKGKWNQNGDYAGVAFGPKGSAEWRLLDSQYFNVAQRRRRAFLIWSSSGERAGQVLIERQSMQGNIEEGGSQKREKRDDSRGRHKKGDGRSYSEPITFNWQASPSQTLVVDRNKSGPLDTSQVKAVLSDSIKPRKLTPWECEVLQGFPPGWTETVSDTQRYKMLGNAATVNVVEWIAKRLKSSSEA